MENRIEIRPGRIININVYKNPASTATAFLFHGLGGRSDQWHDQIDVLKDEYTLIIPDLLGHGKSDKPKPNGSNPYSFTELEQDLQAIFLKYSSDSNIILGHSYGGALATSVTIDHQDNVAKLVLIAPTPCTPKIQIPFIFRLPPPIMEILRPLLEKNFQKLAIDPATSQQLVDSEIIASRNNPMYVIKSMIDGMKDMPRIDVTMLNDPTLILFGEHDQLVPPAISETFYKAIPHQQFEIIPGASHLVLLEKPEIVNRMITKFLAN